MTKWLSVLLVLALAYFFWRHKRSALVLRQKKPAPDAQSGIVMLPCAACGVLSPQTEMLAGQHGHYCNSEHRQRKEG